MFLINRCNINAEQAIFRSVIHSLLAILKPTTMAQIEDLYSKNKPSHISGTEHYGYYTPDSHLGDPRFKPQHIYWMCWFRSFMVLLILSIQLPKRYLTNNFIHIVSYYYNTPCYTIKATNIITKKP
jgi:hypothetical protein